MDITIKKLVQSSEDFSRYREASSARHLCQAADGLRKSQLAGHIGGPHTEEMVKEGQYARKSACTAK